MMNFQKKDNTIDFNREKKIREQQDAIAFFSSNMWKKLEERLKRKLAFSYHQLSRLSPHNDPTKMVFHQAQIQVIEEILLFPRIWINGIFSVKSIDKSDLLTYIGLGGEYGREDPIRTRFDGNKGSDTESPGGTKDGHGFSPGSSQEASRETPGD